MAIITFWLNLPALVVTNTRCPEINQSIFISMVLFIQKLRKVPYRDKKTVTKISCICRHEHDWKESWGLLNTYSRVTLPNLEQVAKSVMLWVKLEKLDPTTPMMPLGGMFPDPPCLQHDSNSAPHDITATSAAFLFFLSDLTKWQKWLCSCFDRSSSSRLVNMRKNQSDCESAVKLSTDSVLLLCHQTWYLDYQQGTI